MVSFPTTQRPADNVLRIQGQRYALATAEQSRQLGQRRSWDVISRTAQDRPLGEPFGIHFDFHHGYGLTFSPGPQGYEQASGWDATTAGKIATWPQHATLESVTDTSYRGWWYYDYASGYLYLFRGRYAVKYIPDDSGSEWSIAEFKTLGASGEVVAGQPAVFNGAVYVPMLTAATGVLLRFYELTTIATPTAEVQTVTITGTPTAGSYTLSFNDGVNTYTTAAIAYNADGPTVQAALRLLPGLQKVTVSTAGTIPNFIHTVTMTAAPTVIATASPPTMGNTDGTTGGAHNIANATTVAGVGDTWNRGEAGVEARYFVVWNKPTVGPVLVRANANNVSMASTAPAVAANWSTVQPVFDSTFDVVSLATFGRLLYCGKPNMLASFDEQGQAVNEIPSISSVVDANNFVGMKEHNGYLYAPHKLGLIRWRPGGQWSIVGAEQDDTLEGDRTTGWGRTIGLAPFGKYGYLSIVDYFNSIGAVVSLEEQQARNVPNTRGALTPHMHHQLTVTEDIAIASLKSQQAPQEPLATWSDDAALGTLAWSSPSAMAANDASYALATGTGQTHYLKGLDLGIDIPDNGVIRGITARLLRSQKVNSALSHLESARGNVGAGAPLSVSITTSAGPDRLLLVWIHAAGNISPGVGGTTTAVTYDGVALTKVSGVVTVSGATVNGEWSLWALANPSVGTKTLAATYTGGSGANYYYQQYTGVAQATPLGTPSTSTLHGNDPSPLDGANTIATAAGDIAVGGFFCTGGPTYTAGSGETIRVQGGSGMAAAILDETAVGASTDLVPTDSSIFTSDYVSIGVAIKPTAYTAEATVVSLIKAGAVVGSNKADTGVQLPTTETEKVYGGSTDLWGTTWTVAQVKASTFGIALSFTIGGSGEVRPQYLTLEVFYDVPGGSNPPSYLVVVQVSADGATANPMAYKLPSAGMTVANDPQVAKFIEAGAIFNGSRVFGPTRATVKRYSAVECYAEVTAATDGELTPGFRIEAQVDDSGDWVPLIDADGQSTHFASGPLELFFPAQVAVGRWVQLRVIIDAVGGQEVGIELQLRDFTLRGFVLSEASEQIKAVLVLGPGQQLDDGNRNVPTGDQQRATLEALIAPPQNGGRTLIEVHDPVLKRDIQVIVQGHGFSEVTFNGETESVIVMQLELERLRAGKR